MKLALLFPGQGAQYVGMGHDLFEKSPEARKIFETADGALGFSLSRLCFEGPFEELTKTQNCQPAVLTASCAALAALREKYPALPVGYVAGLSLGEYSALVAAGVVAFRDAAHLVRRRGQFMEASAEKNPGKMACVLGLEKDIVAGVCRDTGCEIANLNCPGQVVISGRLDALQGASDLLMEKGAKRVIPLDVSGAFHCSLMDEASQKLKAEIEKVVFHKPQVPLVSNVDAREQTDPALIKGNLIKQVNTATYWEISMRLLLGQGVDTFLEIGPGSVLKGLMKKIDPMAKVINIGKWEELQQLAGILS